MTTDARRSDIALNIVDIAVLACFAIVQPLFQLLSRSEALFISHGSRATDVLLLVVAALTVPAGVLALPELLAAKFAPRAAGPVHRVILGFLLTLTILPVVKRATPLAGGACVAIAAVLAAVISVQYLRIRSWRWSVVYLSPALLLFPGLLLFGSPVSAILLPGRAPQLVRARVGNPVPVVMVVFDEFPLSSLMDRRGNIDVALYPNFAGLSRTGTWYRNATTVAEGTLISVPAILDGRYPDPGHPRLPNAAGHPNTLFTLLGGSYRMNVVENNTRLCPEPLCGSSAAPVYRRIMPLVRDSAVLWLYAVLPSDLTRPLPDISQGWANFTNTGGPPTPEMWNTFDELTDWHDRAQQFRAFTNSIQPSPWPAVHFLHVLLPHAPWEYLPSGQKYPTGERKIRGLRGTNDSGEDPNRWSGDSWEAAQSYQRHLLQVGFVDRFVGDLLEHLRDAGLYDSSMIIITADHGTSFRPGDSRRLVTPANHADLMAVPLFIKYPGQHAGAIDDRNALTIDILPTIADTLKVKPSWKVDGKPLAAADARTSPAKIIFADSGRKFEFSGGLNDLQASVNYKLGLFGDDSNLYDVGDRHGWTGREAPAASVEPGLRYELHRAAYFSKVDPRAPRLVTHIRGRIIRGRSFHGRSTALPLAVSVNGIIHAVTETYRDGGEDTFAAMVPHTALRTGRNEIGVFLIRDGGTGLARLEGGAKPVYEWGTRIDFGENGNAGPYFGTGWSNPSSNLTWTDGRLATLYLPTPAPQSDVTLRGNFAAFTHKWKLWRQRVRVLVNKHEVANWALKINFREHSAVIPRHYFAGADTTEIAFEMPDATAPISIGANRDSRTLGAAIMWMQLSTVQP